MDMPGAPQLQAASWLGFAFAVIALAACGPVQPGSPPETEVPTAYTNDLGMEFVNIHSGWFRMGAGRDSRESKHPLVTLDAFQIMRTEVTNAQFEEFKKRPRHPRSPHDDSPVVNVTRLEVLEFIEWLNERTRDTYRLPTEAEWEYAARAGSLANFPWGEDWRADLAEGAGYGEAPLIPVKKFPPNKFGLYGVVGNATEMTYDRYSELTDRQLRNPLCYEDPKPGELDYEYVERGLGPSSNFPWVWHRSIGIADIPLDSLGFRLVRGPLPPDMTIIEPLRPKPDKN
ncbi:MAG TPA: SUMF1/EgtB/PvdO family nonheme iron enzyme [Fimbriimonadaceae bacterium]|nr:SUMF1/EgtB/PvdO family nonheme iron enzyme [Fimbriimonadaceae bacterium]HRE94591.1 SUMF1/EgtB/PvdO family nonheme iron enzyme [Fimbriimonadaceae bacterium]